MLTPYLGSKRILVDVVDHCSYFVHHQCRPVMVNIVARILSNEIASAHDLIGKLLLNTQPDGLATNLQFFYSIVIVLVTCFKGMITCVSGRFALRLSSKA